MTTTVTTLADLSPAIMRSAVASLYDELTPSSVQERINEIVDEHDPALIVELIRFPPLPSHYGAEVDAETLSAIGVALFINTLVEPQSPRQMAREQVADALLSTLGWTLSDAARAAAEHCMQRVDVGGSHGSGVAHLCTAIASCRSYYLPS